MPDRKNMHRELASFPLAYFITIRTYGTWLHGDERGSVDRKHNVYAMPVVTADAGRQAFVQAKMRNEPMLLAADSAALVEKTVEEVCGHRGWRLYIVRARTNHFHVVVGANLTAERMMNDFKAWATRRLREHKFVRDDQDVWAQHGSTPHLWTGEDIDGAIDYVKNWQGGPLQKTWEEVQREREKARQKCL